MSTHAEEAVAMFAEGFNCAQAVLTCCGTRFGISRDLALRIAGPFGGGMGRTGNVCGAVTGAFMVIGLKHTKTDPKDEQAKKIGHDLVREFIKRFEAGHGSIVCRQLLGYDLSAAEGLQKAKDQGLFKTLCPKFVRAAAEILEEIL